MLEAVLLQMGSTADEIASFLLERGIKGRRRNAVSNPLAQFINAYDITWTGARVTGSEVCFDDDQIIDFTLPPQHCEFIARFNEGVYPELVGSNAWRPKYVASVEPLLAAARELVRLHTLNQRFRGWDEAIKTAEQKVLKAALNVK